MTTVKGRVLRRVLNHITDLISGGLTLDNYTIGLAREDDTLVARDDVGGFHYFMGSMAIESLIVDLQYARPPVATYALLPAGDPDGSMRVVLTEDMLYIKSNGTWTKSAFVPSTVINHNDTAGLNTGDYQHLTAAEKTDLTDLGDCTAHYHASDRSRSNHTGTQLSNTISDWANAVRSVVLTGLSTAISTTISATDTILAALGKLQEQLNARPINHASNGTTYGIASSTMYGHAKCSTTSPLMDGEASAGTLGALFSAYDHRHPSDTSRETAWTRATITAASNVDDLLTPGVFAVSNGASATGMPAGCYGWGTFIVLPFSTGTLTQIYTPHRPPTSSNSGMYIRISYTGTFTTWQHVTGKDYNDTIYAKLDSSPHFTGDVISDGQVSGGSLYSDGACTFGSTAVQNKCDMRADVYMGTSVSTANADGTISPYVTGFINRATFTAARNWELPYPHQNKMLFVSNDGASTTYALILKPPSGVTIQYGILSLTLRGGNTNGLKGVLLCGTSDTHWSIISTYVL